MLGTLAVGTAVARRPLPHHRAYGSVHGDSRGLRERSSINEGSPSDRKQALESPLARAWDRARYQGPCPLPAVLRASRGADCFAQHGLSKRGSLKDRVALIAMTLDEAIASRKSNGAATR